MSNKVRNYLIILSPLLITLLFYLNSFMREFVFDDSNLGFILYLIVGFILNIWFPYVIYRFFKEVKYAKVISYLLFIDLGLGTFFNLIRTSLSFGGWFAYGSTFSKVIQYLEIGLRLSAEIGLFVFLILLIIYLKNRFVKISMTVVGVLWVLSMTTGLIIPNFFDDYIHISIVFGIMAFLRTLSKCFVIYLGFVETEQL